MDALAASRIGWQVPAEIPVVGDPKLVLRQMIKRCQRSGTRVILSGLREQPRAILMQMKLKPDGAQLQFVENFAEAIALATAS